MEQQAPTFQNIDADKSWVLKSLGLGATDLLPGLEPLIVNTGNGYLIIPVRDEFRLAGIQPDMNQIWSISEKYGLIGFYPYTPSGNGFDATARMFAPYYGINEEAGTGMAAGPLAVYLYETGQQRKTAFRLEQGRFMDTPSPSVINVELESNGGNIIRLFAGGDAYVATEIQVDISEI